MNNMAFEKAGRTALHMDKNFAMCASSQPKEESKA